MYILAYFHQSIAESGSALASWAFDSNPEKHAKVKLTPNDYKN